MDFTGSDRQIELNCTLAVAEAIGSPRALTVSLLAQAGEWEQLLELECRPGDYEDVGNFADDYLITKILSKSSNLPLNIDVEAKARSAFYEAEAYNRATNERFSMTDAVDHPDWWWRCQKYLRRIMGPLDRKALDEVENLMRHGTGSVVGMHDELVPSKKYDMLPTVNEGLSDLADAIMGPTWTEYRSLGKPPVVVEGNQFFTVPKDAKTLRGCAKGPSLSVYAQMGFGRYLVKRLKHFGCDLHDQGFNQFLASRAQEWGLATLDLKTASELGALVPYNMLMSDQWANALGRIREEATIMPPVYGDDGSVVEGRRVVRLAKYSAMGNGFTFPLQTAVFISVVRSVVPPVEHGLTCAYGDDLILPQRYASAVIEALEYLGFKVNHKKSCLAGNFFESCGTDWFNGQNVRPFFLRRTPESDDMPSRSGIPYHVQIGNRLREWSRRRNQMVGKEGCDARFEDLWKRLVADSPRAWRKPVPMGVGDSGFVTSFGEACAPGWCSKGLRPLIEAGPNTKLSDVHVYGWEGIAYECMKVRPVRVDRRTYGVLLASLAGMPVRVPKCFPASERADTQCVDDWTKLSDQASLGEEPVRGLFGKPTSRWAITPVWPDGIDWV